MPIWYNHRAKYHHLKRFQDAFIWECKKYGGQFPTCKSMNCPLFCFKKFRMEA